MKIGILLTSVGNFAPEGFYNSQEIGLIKELEPYFSQIRLYKAIPENAKRMETKIEGCEHTTVSMIPTPKKGSNGLWNCDLMDSDMDALLYFSDTQLVVKKVYRWCQKHNILFLPYIGVIESHSSNRIKKMIMNVLSFRTIQVYKKCLCLVKTPDVGDALKKKGVKRSIVVPVGVDTSLLYANFEVEDVIQLREKYGYHKEDKIILFVGRMSEEKRPLEMIDLYKKLLNQNKNYKLLMVGRGELLPKVKENVKELDEKITIMEQVPNKDMWELYCVSDFFVNLNRNEIFGMAILEAMYYKCRVIAWEAPGPNFILKTKGVGVIVKNENELIEAIKEEKETGQCAHDEICRFYDWKCSAKMIFDLVQNRG